MHTLTTSLELSTDNPILPFFLQEVKSILLKLKKDVVATEELIRETKIGVAVHKLRQNANKEVADLAKEIVRKWKADVGHTTTGKLKATDSQSPSASASAVPSPSPAPGSPNVPSPAPAPTASSGTATPPAPTTSSAPINSDNFYKPVPTPAPAPSPAPPTATTPAPKRRESLLGAPRTHKTDGIEFHKGEGSTGDKTRDTCVQLVYDALASDSDAPTDLILKRARGLEAHVWKQLPPPGGTNAYRTKMRSLFLNLKAANNPALREDVVSGEISVARLYGMTPGEMASEEQQAVNRKLVEENLFKAKGAAPQQAETDAFQCGKCKQRRQ